MAEIHDLITTQGKKAAIEAGWPADLVRAAGIYLADEDTGLGFAYSGWAQVSLPVSRPADDAIWSIASDRVKLLIEPGRRLKGDDYELIGVPWGCHARLILLWLQSEALRTNSRQVELGGSMREWLRRIGVSVGGKTDRSVREQAERISRCRLTFHLMGTNGSGLVNQSIVDKALFIDVNDKNERQGRLSLEVAQLSEGFFEQLKRHPMPLEEAAIRALSNNAKALDVYLWLAYRLHSLKSDKLVTWSALKSQFGIGTAAMFNFRSKFTTTLGLATAVYPAARLDVTEQGVIIKPSRPPVTPKLLLGPVVDSDLK
jgi:Plasmid encoded RepA protein